MNQRLRALAEKANIEFTYDPTETPIRAFAECWEDDLEKFADMIVKECAGRVDWILAEGGGTQGDLIREHFGVAELKKMRS
jgi:hypothetical protein